MRFLPFLLLALLAALAVWLLGGWGIPKAVPASTNRSSGSAGNMAVFGSTGPYRARATSASAYWRAEHKLVDALHVQGRLGAEVRRLRVENRRLRLVHARTHTGRYAIRLAASTFHVPEADLVTVAGCETGGSYSPAAYNVSSGAAGLFQFLSGTWAAQGLAGFSAFDPVANALAAARIVAREGWRQWSCQPH